jgi:hypothetical protein
MALTTTKITHIDFLSLQIEPVYFYKPDGIAQGYKSNLDYFNAQ